MKGHIRQVCDLEPMAVTTIEFNGMFPNYFRVNNGGDTRIYGGVRGLPTSRLYDFKIEQRQVRLYCTDKGYPKIYLYNPSGSTVPVIVEAFVEEFSVEVLAFSDFNIDTNEDQTINVEIGGFTSSLPTGNNQIGSVDVRNVPANVTQSLSTIAAKDYTAKLDNIISALSTTPVNDVTELSTFESRCKVVDLTQSTTIIDLSSDTKSVHEIVTLSNDTESDIVFTFTYNSGTQEDFTIKAGEVFNNFKCNIKTITAAVGTLTTGNHVRTVLNIW